MSEGTLLATINTITRLSGEDQLYSYISPLLLLLSLIPQLHYAIRKHLLDCTRIQSSQKTNSTLNASYNKLVATFHSISVPKQSIRYLRQTGIVAHSRDDNVALWISTVLDLFENFYDSPTACTVLSYMVRAEATHYLDEFISIGTDTIDKELRASQQTNLPMQLNYRGLFTDNPEPIHEGTNVIPTKTIRMWKLHLNTIKEHLSLDSTVLLPHYNKRKNVGYKTQDNYYIACKLLPSTKKQITTLDLLQFYSLTGIRVTGPLELRQSWRFNDLKPRSYYCLGGDAFWPAIWIKDITKMLLSAFPSTHPFSRYEVHRIRKLNADEILITYDYTSFTTSLAELKYFMWYLSTAFEGFEVEILDVNLGLQTIDLGAYLAEYNEAINHHQEFDVSRLFDGDVDSILYQNRSGSLGVGGNIGLSGLNHGISLAGFNDSPDTDSVVGDDALLKILISMSELLIVCVNKLGEIHPEKVTAIPVPTLDNPIGKEETAFKYLKRPLRVNFDGEIETGTLDFFPNVASCLYPAGDGIHTNAFHDVETLVRSYVMQVGKYLANLQREHVSNDPDCELMLVILRSVYRKYSLPIEGAIPTRGTYVSEVEIKNRRETIYISSLLWIPPLDTLEVFHTPWLQILYTRYAGIDVTIPHMVDGDIPPPVDIYPGQEFPVTEGSRFLALMEDLGHFERRQEMVTLPFDEHCLIQSERQFLTDDDTHRLRPLYTVTVLTIPSYYTEYVLRVFGDPDFPQEAWKKDMELESLGYTLANEI